MLPISFNIILSLFGPATVGGAVDTAPCGQDAYEVRGGEDPHALTSGKSVRGRICLRDLDAYALTVFEGDAVEISVNGERADSLVPTVTGPDQKSLKVTKVRRAHGVVLRFIVSSTGVHQIRLAGRSAYSQAYELQASWRREVPRVKAVNQADRQNAGHRLDFLLD